MSNSKHMANKILDRLKSCGSHWLNAFLCAYMKRDVVCRTRETLNVGLQHTLLLSNQSHISDKLFDV